MAWDGHYYSCPILWIHESAGEDWDLSSNDWVENCASQQVFGRQLILDSDLSILQLELLHGILADNPPLPIYFCLDILCVRIDPEIRDSKPDLFHPLPNLFMEVTR